MFFLAREVDVERLNTYGIYWLGSLIREAYLYARQPLGLWVHIALECRSYLLTALDPKSSFRLRISVEQAKYMDSQLGHVVSLHRQYGADHELTEDDVKRFNSAYFAFNSAIGLELGQAPTFFVTPKGVYDTDSLINDGSSVYEDLQEHLPQEAIEDTNQAARCLAFTLPTASGFHMARATEAVARKYLLHLGCKEEELKSSNWGGYVNLMTAKKGNSTIAHHFDQLRSLHRNPMIHPEVTLAMTEAQSFWAMCTSLIMSMVAEMNLPLSPSEPSESPDPGEANV